MDRFLPIALLAVLAAACSASASSSTPGTCGSSADCGPGLACRDGRCVMDPGPFDDGGVPPIEPDAGTPPSPPVECRLEAAPHPFENPIRELRWRGEGLPFPRHEQATVSPVVVDFIPELEPDGDTVPELIFVSWHRDGSGRTAVLRVVSGRPPYETRMTLAGDGTGPVGLDSDARPSLRWDTHPAAGDLDGDGQPEVVAVLESGGAVAFRSDGSELWRNTFPAGEYGANGALAIADLHHDGLPEVVLGRMVMDGQTGEVRWIGTEGQGRNGQGPLTCVADLDGSGDMEIVAGRTVYDADGGIVWEAPGGTGDGFCAIADVSDMTGAAGRDGVPEVIRVASGHLYVHDARTGEVRWSRSLVGDSGSGGAPTVADFDGDGEMEIGVAGARWYAVYDAACGGGGRPAGCDGDYVLWRQAVEDDSSAVTSSTVFDFNGDGRAEVVYNDEQYFMVLDGVDGTVLFRDGNPSQTRTEQPIVVDVDNDGNAEIIFTANDDAGFAGDHIPSVDRVPGVEIWSSADDAWVGASPTWNQHTFHIDNVHVSGTIPRAEAPSWATHNTYRLNRPVEPILAAPNLTAEVDAFDDSRCAEGILTLCAMIVNRGEVRVGPGLAVTFYDGDPALGGSAIASAPTTRALEPSGLGERVCVDWTPAPTDTRRVFVRVDADESERECIEDDNTVDLGDALCIPFG